MKIEHIINETTTAGAVSSVAMPLGQTQRRTTENVKGLIPAEKVLKAKKKGPYANSLSEGKDKKPVIEADLQEDDLIIIPGQSKRLKAGFIPKAQDRTDHEVEMAKADLLALYKNTKSVLMCIKDISEDEGLEGWVQEKIIKASDYMNTLAEYFEGKKIQEMSGGVIAAGGVGEGVAEGLLDRFKKKTQQPEDPSYKKGWELCNKDPSADPIHLFRRHGEGLDRNQFMKGFNDNAESRGMKLRGDVGSNELTHGDIKYKEFKRDRGVAEDNEQKYRVTYDMYFTNREKPLYTKTRTVRADSEEEAIKIIQDLIGGRNHRIEKVVAEGKFTINRNTGAKLDPRTGVELPPKEKPMTMKQMFAQPKQPKLTLDDVWLKIQSVVSNIYPDGDPIDHLAPWLEKHGIRDFKIGEILDRAAKKNGYKNLYDYWESMGDLPLSEQGVAEGLNEMDKTQTSPGRDGDIDWTKKQIHLGPEYVIKAKDVAKHALKALDKTMKKSTPKKKGVAEGISNAVIFFRGEPILSQERLNQLKSSIGKPYPILRKEGSAKNIGTYMTNEKIAKGYITVALAGQGKGGAVTKIAVDLKSFQSGDGGIDEAVIITNIAGLVSDQTPNKNDPLRIQDRKKAMLKYLGPGVKKYLNDPLLSDPKIVQSWYNPEFAQQIWNTIKSGKQAETKPGESNILERMKRILGPLAEKIRRDPEVISYFIAHKPNDWVEYNFRMNSDGSGTKVLDVKYYPPAKQGVAEGTLTEKAKSTAQQKFFGMAHAMQKGKKIPGASKELKDVTKSMSKSDVTDFAKTKHKDLPSHVKKEK